MEILYTSKFKKDLRKLAKQGKDLGQLKRVIQMIADGKPLPPRLRDHALIGNWKGTRDPRLAFDL